jgi:4-deoxy-L-threo-5-hexosulose-uronate ketol-isomerase
MRLVHCPNIENYTELTTPQLRSHFLLADLGRPGACELVHWDVDRTLIGFALPTDSPLRLEAPKNLIAADFFCERREAGVINLGGSGRITTDGKIWEAGKCDTLYIGRGTRDVSFESADPSNPAIFYIVSYPAHADYPTALSAPETTNRVELGGGDTANERVIHQQIHQGGIRSCQLVMGWTELAVGSVWNTYPPHTHLRRSEVYNYFDLPDDQVVMHFMGPQDCVRNLVVRNHQPVLSPPWSMHCGAGTSNYKFVWAMGGENQEFTDMDGIQPADLT